MADNGDQQPIELAELVRRLREELQTAAADGKAAPADESGERLEFRLGPVEVEATVSASRDRSANGKVRFWVVQAGGEAKSSRSDAQRITLTLHPEAVKPDGERTDYTVSGREVDGEI